MHTPIEPIHSVIEAIECTTNFALQAKKVLFCFVSKGLHGLPAFIELALN